MKTMKTQNALNERSVFFQFNSLYAAGKDQEDHAVQSFLYNKKSNDRIRCVDDLILSIRYRIF